MSSDGKKTVLVTGGAGYIGSHTCMKLADCGILPVCLDNLSRGHDWAVKWGPLIVADICDKSAVLDALKTYRPSAVIHLAALCCVHESFEKPEEYQHVNIDGTQTVLDSMVNCGVRNLIFSSSCSVFGLPTTMPVSEDHPRNPISPYGETKMVAEDLIAQVGQTENLNWVCLRYFNACGAEPRGHLGESHDPETHVIPKMIQAALNRQVFEIYGDTFPTSDGTAVRDFVHVCDIADAHIRAIDYLEDGGQSQVMNIGTGKGVSIAELIQEIGRIMGREIDVKVKPSRPGDPPEAIANPRLAHEKLKWTANQSQLDSIIKTAVAWHSRSEY